MKLIDRLLKQSTHHFFLLGPRGTGKTTWLHQHYTDAAWLDLLDSSIYRTYLSRPERLLDFVAPLKPHTTIVIDEVQRIPSLLHIVHKIMEENKSLQFVLTGSSARKLRSAGVDLLSGRAIIRNMHPFISAELGSDFQIDKALTFGCVPVVWSSEIPQESMKAYLHFYIEQEIKTEGIVRNLEHFIRFLEASTFSHANVLNIADISRECEVKRTTVVGYFQILQDLHLAHKIPIFSRQAKRLLVSHEKFYLFDCGVFQALRPAGSIDRPQEISGQALEGLVYQHLNAWIDYGGWDAKIYYWRTRAGSEVDFIVYGKDCFHAIEVKNSSRIRSEDLNSLQSFKSDYPECTPVLLYRGKETIMQSSIYCTPVEKYLRAIIPNTPLPAPKIG